MSEVILSADIGGTNTRLSLYEVVLSESFINMELTKEEKLPGRLILEKKYGNDKYDSLLEVISVFLKEANFGKVPTTACLAVAGPVTNNKATLTNREHWEIDGETLAKALGLKRIQVVNDFVAMGFGLLTLNEDTECVVLQKAKKNPTAPIACIGAGTGLGECFLTPKGDGNYECYASEGGHAEFAPRNDVEIRLLHYLSKKFQGKHRISIERVVSGPGLVNIYEFLSSQERPSDITPSIHQQIISAPESDKARIIAVNEEVCAVCAHTMRIFTAAYGAEAGVAALKWIPTGGLYLTGGLTPKNIDYITGKKVGAEGLFIGALLDKGRVSPVLRNIPIYAVMVEDLGERGALYTALRLLQEVGGKVPSTNQASVSCAAKNCPCGANCTCGPNCACGKSTPSSCTAKNSPCGANCTCGPNCACGSKCPSSSCAGKSLLIGAMLLAAMAAGACMISKKRM